MENGGQDKRQEAARWYDENCVRYGECAKKLAELIEKVLKKRQIQVHSITCRLKGKDSYLEKCKKEKYANPIVEIMDVSGIRIIAYTNKDVGKICEVIEKELCIDDKNSEDKGDNLGEDRVGYLSVHYIVRLDEERAKLSEYEDFKDVPSEIQVRTLLQHAWAEIEHDRNYKFSGVLPSHLKRKFHLIAGTLELMDQEFDSLSEEIDRYEKETSEKTKKGDFDISIDSVSLKNFLDNKFPEIQNSELKSIAIDDDIVRELNRFGFSSLRDINGALDSDTVEKLKVRAGKTSYIGLLRDLMIIKDAEKYFGRAYDMAWGGTSRAQIKYWESCGAGDIERYLEEQGIDINYE